MTEVPKRKPNRLKDYDYSQEGAYFVTICAKGRSETFATIDNIGTNAAGCSPYGGMKVKLSDIGQIVDISINNISKIYPFACVDTYVIMPNHVHMIIGIYEHGRQVAAPTTGVQTIIGHMKRSVSIQCGYSVWQKSFHDHIIRNEYYYRRIAEYIENNPETWMEDCFYMGGNGNPLKFINDIGAPSPRLRL